MGQRHQKRGATSVLCGGSIGSRAVACISTLFVLAVCAANAMAQISPGPLAKPHSFLNGPTKCTSCHRVGGQGGLKCLECHTEIAGRIAQGRGLHARVVKDPTKTCAPCHSEHNGEEFPLVRWQPSQQQFDHAQTNWLLTGKHAALSCNRCHLRKNIVASEMPLIKVKDLNRTFLGAAIRTTRNLAVRANSVTTRQTGKQYRISTTRRRAIR